MDELIEELAVYYQALGYPMYTKEKLAELSEQELLDLYEITFPNREA